MREWIADKPSEVPHHNFCYHINYNYQLSIFNDGSDDDEVIDLDDDYDESFDDDFDDDFYDDYGFDDDFDEYN